MRAQRYPLELPLWFRSAGASEWRAGMTLNISGSGVLFRARPPEAQGTGVLAVERSVEMRIVMGGRTASAAEVKCGGRIVRVESEQGDSVVAAAQFSDFQFTRGAPKV